MVGRKVNSDVLGTITVLFAGATFLVMAFQWIESRRLTVMQKEIAALQLKKLKDTVA